MLLLEAVSGQVVALGTGGYALRLVRSASPRASGCEHRNVGYWFARWCLGASISAFSGAVFCFELLLH